MIWGKQNLPGVLLATSIAIAAYVLGNYIPLVGGAVFGILIGIIISVFAPQKSSISQGVNFTSKTILQWAVIILGSGLSLRQVYATGAASVALILVTITTAFGVVAGVGRLLKVHFNLKSLIGVGTAICGGSAIAAVSPIIEAEDQEISYAISTIFLFNIVAVFVFPAIGHALKLSQMGFGLFAGTAINDTSSVVAAGYTYGNAAGDYATIVKLTRTIMIVPVALGFVALSMRRRKQESRQPHGTGFNAMKIFPWFILGFLLMATLNTSGVLNHRAISVLNEIGKFMIIMALSAIGLKTNIRKMSATGLKPILLGFIVWVSVALTSIAVQLASRQW
jgi:uncharacterized integral membrane protein (TIGR00698 family)